MELTWFPRRPLNYIQGSDCAATGTPVGGRPRFFGSVPHLPQQAHREGAPAAVAMVGAMQTGSLPKGLTSACLHSVISTPAALAAGAHARGLQRQAQHDSGLSVVRT